MPLAREDDVGRSPMDIEFVAPNFHSDVSSDDQYDFDLSVEVIAPSGRIRDSRIVDAEEIYWVRFNSHHDVSSEPSCDERSMTGT